MKRKILPMDEHRKMGETIKTIRALIFKLGDNLVGTKAYPHLRIALDRMEKARDQAEEVMFRDHRKECLSILDPDFTQIYYGPKQGTKIVDIFIMDKNPKLEGK